MFGIVALLSNTGSRGVPGRLEESSWGWAG